MVTESLILYGVLAILFIGGVLLAVARARNENRHPHTHHS